METFKFSEFFAPEFETKSIILSKIHWYIPVNEAYILVAGTGIVLIGLVWLEEKGYIKINKKMLKFSVVCIIAYIIGRFIFTTNFWSVFHLDRMIGGFI